MKYIIIDDEPAAIEVLKFHLKNIPFMELMATFRDPLVAIELPSGEYCRFDVLGY